MGPAIIGGGQSVTDVRSGRMIATRAGPAVSENEALFKALGTDPNNPFDAPRETFR